MEIYSENASDLFEETLKSAESFAPDSRIRKRLSKKKSKNR